MAPAIRRRPAVAVGDRGGCRGARPVECGDDVARQHRPRARRPRPRTRPGRQRGVRIGAAQRSSSVAISPVAAFSSVAGQEALAGRAPSPRSRTNPAVGAARPWTKRTTTVTMGSRRPTAAGCGRWRRHRHELSTGSVEGWRRPIPPGARTATGSAARCAGSALQLGEVAAFGHGAGLDAGVGDHNPWRRLAAAQQRDRREWTWRSRRRPCRSRPACQQRPRRRGPEQPRQPFTQQFRVRDSNSGANVRTRRPRLIQTPQLVHQRQHAGALGGKRSLAPRGGIRTGSSGRVGAKGVAPETGSAEWNVRSRAPPVQRVQRPGQASQSASTEAVCWPSTGGPPCCTGVAEAQRAAHHAGTVPARATAPSSPRAALLHQRVGEHLVHALDGTGRHAGFVQHGQRGKLPGGDGRHQAVVERAARLAHAQRFATGAVAPFRVASTWHSAELAVVARPRCGGRRAHCRRRTARPAGCSLPIRPGTPWPIR